MMQPIFRLVATRHGPLSVAALQPKAPARPTFVLVPPTFVSAQQTYGPLAARLAAAHRVVLVDLPGHGACPAWESPLTRTSMENLADAVSDALADPSVAVEGDAVYVGTSWGANVGLDMLFRARADAGEGMMNWTRFFLFSLDPYPMPLPAAAFMLFMANVIGMTGSFPASERVKMVDAGFTEGWMQGEGKEDVEGMREHALKVPAGVLGGVTRAVAWGPADRLARLKSLGSKVPPATLVLARSDPLFDAEAVKRRLEADGVPLDVVLVDGKHVWVRETPDVAAEIIEGPLA